MLLMRTRRDMPAPWQDMAGMRNRLRQLFEAPFDPDFFPLNVGWNPPVEITETDNEIMLTAELPGMTKDNVEISLEDNVLTLRGEKKEEWTEDVKERRLHVFERTYGAFQRSFTLPREVDAEKVWADFTNGVLTLHLPKAERAKGRKIEIAAT